MEVGSGKWEAGSGKWEAGSGKWEVDLFGGRAVPIAIGTRPSITGCKKVSGSSYIFKRSFRFGGQA